MFFHTAQTRSELFDTIIDFFNTSAVSNVAGFYVFVTLTPII